MSILDELVALRSEKPAHIPMDVWLLAAEAVENAMALALDSEPGDASGTLHVAVAEAILADRKIQSRNNLRKAT